ncbi:protein PHLOEM PROTEIN 2-LIKE A10-like [Typha latifolia]|uniref:protein PHLOEM PROTEIN 2-LIKE A10-like n=1 Tax=Typha latifolia TaxID=4733 RepID=UPI003C2FE2B3
MEAVVDLPRRRRRWLLLAAAAGISGYGAYRLYHLPSVVRRRKKLVRLFHALIALVNAVSSSAEAVALVSSDLNRFLRSDSDEIPSSLVQISKISRSEEFLSSVSSVSQALTKGIVRGLVSVSDSQSDRVLDKLFSPAGSGFVSVVVGSFAKNLVMAFDSEIDRTAGFPRWLDLMCSEKGKEVVGHSVQVFVSTAVAVYLERTISINACDEILSGITNPAHEAKVKDLLVSVCNGAVETLVKTSHQVMTTPNLGSPVPDLEIVRREVSSRSNSSLAILSNRRLVLDVTGRVTSEMVKSFLDFLLWKLSSGAKRSIGVARDEVVEKGLEAVRYLSAKSMAIFTICLALCMHVSIGTRLLFPV